MSAPPARLRPVDRGALVLLCLILAGSVSLRVYMHGTAVETAGPADGGRPVDLGEGVFLPRAEAGGRTVTVPSCSDPTTVYLVSPSPHGVGASLDAPPNPDDRILYAYRGRTFGGRFGSTEVSVAHFARRALGVLRMPGGADVEDLAVKMIVPAGCDASPEDVMATLRQGARPSR